MTPATMKLLKGLLLAVLIALVDAGTRPNDVKWLASKAAEDGVVATGTGLLYKGTHIDVTLSGHYLVNLCSSRLMH